MGIRYCAQSEVTTTTLAGAVYAEFLASATRGTIVHSITIETKDALGSQIGLGRAFAIGTGTGFATGVCHRVRSSSNPIGTASARINTAWSQAPTGYNSRLRDINFPSGTGFGGTGISRDMWLSYSDGPLTIEPGGSLLLTNQASAPNAALIKIGITWEEGEAADR
jgi:hypothetical protein